MKKILLSALALLAVSGIGFAQNLPSYVPANGLIGWWPFNGNANDESGNGNNGLVNGATLTSDRNGVGARAYNCNGQLQNITVTSFNFNFSNMTLAFWVNPSDSTSNQRIVTHNWNTGKFSTSMNEGGFVGTVNSTIDPNRNININGPIRRNQWVHFTMSFDGLALKAYRNGQLLAVDQNLSGAQLNPGIATLFFGGDLFYPLNGKIDDIAIYNRALTQQEITALYQGGNTTANCLDLPSNLQQGLVGYWPFCGNANDESGNGNNGTVNGATLTTDRFGNAGSAYDFDGLNDFIQVSPSNSLNNVRNVSVGLWAKIDAFPLQNLENGISALVTKWFGGGECDNNADHFGTWISYDSTFYGGSKLYPFLSDMPHSTTKVIPDNWYHLVFSHDSLIGGQIFVNGILQDEVSLTGSLCKSLNDLIFGSNNNGRFLNGSLDDIAIWNRALSPQEITQLYNQGICKTSITVTDTLLIHTGITSYNPVAYQNTLKVWPNPGNQDITLDAGNLASMQGWKIKISNSLGQEVYPATLISQQQQVLDLSNWGGNGLYLLHLINPQGHITEVKKIILAP